MMDIDKPLKKLIVYAENEENEDVVVIFAQPSKKDLEQLFCEKFILNMASDCLWTKSEGELMEGGDEGDRNGEDGSDKKRKGEELWLEMWKREVELREIAQKAMSFEERTKESKREYIKYIKQEYPNTDVQPMRDYGEDNVNSKSEHFLYELNPNIEESQEQVDRKFEIQNSEDHLSPKAKRQPVYNNADHEMVFECDICHKTCTSAPNLKNHMMIHTGEKPFACDFCGKGFITKGQMEKHSVTHLEKSVHECYICEEIFDYALELEKHMKKHGSNDADRTCKVCGKYFPSKGRLTDHIRIHTGEKPFACDICGKAFNQNSALTRHKTIHNEKPVQECSICKETFTSMGFLDNHMKVHMEEKGEKEEDIEKPYSCEYCKKAFAEEISRDRHVKASHTHEKIYECNVCEKKLKSGVALRDHKNFHLGIKPFECTICGKRFTYKSTFAVHKRIHSGVTPYSCNLCPLKFKTRQILRGHLLAHTGEKPFRCDVCGKAFLQQGNLNQHAKSHTGEKPYSCEICGKSFTVADAVTRHMRIHTGEKPYSCDVCGKKFALTGGLIVHKRTHTGEKPYSCEICGKAFVTSSQMQRHKKTHKEFKQENFF